MAFAAVVGGFGRIVETASAVSGNSAEQVRIVVVLPAKEILVVVEFLRKMNLVAGRTEFSRLMKRLQKRLLVERWFCFDKLIIDPL